MKHKLFLLTLYVFGLLLSVNAQITIEAESFTATEGPSANVIPGFNIYTVAGASGGAGINYNQSDDKARYSLMPPVTGKYQVTYYISTPLDGTIIKIKPIGQVNQEVLTTVPNNGSWDDFQPLVASSTIDLYSGDNWFIEISSVGAPEGWQWNLDKIELTRVGDFEAPLNGLVPYNTKTTQLIPEPGSYATFTLNPIPSFATELDVEWTSSDPSIVSIPETGTVYMNYLNGGVNEVVNHAQGVSPGEATITATSADGAYSVEFQVFVGEGAGITLQGESFFAPSWGGFDIVQHYGITAINSDEDSDFGELNLPTFETGEYAVSLRAATVSDNASLELYFGFAPDTALSAQLDNTGHLESYESMVLPNTVRMVNGIYHGFFLSNTGEIATDLEWNLDYLTFSRIGDIVVEGLSAHSETSVTVYEQMYTNLEVLIEPYCANNDTIIWTSSDPSIVTCPELGWVNTNGGGPNPITPTGIIGNYNVYGIAPGTATVTATSADGDFSVDFTINVVSYSQITIQAEDFVDTDGTIDDSPYGGSGYGVNDAGTNINYVNSGDWAEYTFDVTEDGEYEISYYISSPSDNAEITSYIDGSLVSVDAVPNNGEWDSYMRLDASSTVNLTQGSKTLKLVASGSNTWQWNLERVYITRIGNMKSAIANEEIANTIINYTIYPTAFDNEFTIELNSAANEAVNVIVINSLGQPVLHSVLEAGENKQVVDASSLSKGIYFVNIGGTVLSIVK